MGDVALVRRDARLCWRGACLLSEAALAKLVGYLREQPQAV